MRRLCLLLSLALLAAAGCADAIPEVRDAPAEGEPLVEVLAGGALLNLDLYWPYFVNGGPNPPPEDGMLHAGARRRVIARLPGGDWLRVEDGWIAADRIRLVAGALDQAPIVLIRGLWLLSPQSEADPALVTAYASWNSWQWDPEGGAIWYRHVEASPGRYGYAPVSRMIINGEAVQREHSNLSGDVLAAPGGGAVLVRERLHRDAPRDKVHILDADGAVHMIAQQCSTYFTDSYRPFGGDAAWSPDGQFVVLRDRTGDVCEDGGATVYDRGGAVTRNLADPESPYRQSWYREPHFADQVGTDQTCGDAPPGVALSDQRDGCQWSPDRRWFATMPGPVENPHLGELLIYSADGTLLRRFLVAGWPCNTFQWSSDSLWLAYGGPSGCA